MGVGRDDLAGVVVRPVKGKLPANAVLDVVPRSGRQEPTQVIDVVFPAPLPDEQKVGRDFDKVGIAPESGAESGHHVIVNRMEEQVPVLRHLKVVVDAAVIVPQHVALGVKRPDASLLDT